MDNFLAITESKDVDIAMIFLNDNEWNLEVRKIGCKYNKIKKAVQAYEAENRQALSYSHGGGGL